MEKYNKTTENQDLNDFLLETLAWINSGDNLQFPTTKNCFSFPKYAISERVVV